MKTTFTLILCMASLTAAAGPSKNSVSCVAKKNTEGHLTTVAYGFGSLKLSQNVEESLGSLYNSQKGTGYCQSMKYIGGDLIEYKTVKVISSESPIEYKSPCQFTGKKLHLNIDKKVVSIEEGYTYALKDGEHEFGSGDIIKIELLTDLPLQDRDALTAECQKIADRNL